VILSEDLSEVEEGVDSGLTRPQTALAAALDPRRKLHFLFRLVTNLDELCGQLLELLGQLAVFFRRGNREELLVNSTVSNRAIFKIWVGALHAAVVLKSLDAFHLGVVLLHSKILALRPWLNFDLTNYGKYLDHHICHLDELLTWGKTELFTGCFLLFTP
jgi:hypothetical protein